jgi:hypothetical protein
VLTWLGAAALCAAALVAARWLGRRHDALGRPRAFPVWSVVLLAVAGTAMTTPGVRRELAERRLEAAAGALAGREVDVECQTLGGAFVDAGAELGYVPFGADGEPEPRTLIKWEPCRDLMAWLRSGKGDPTHEQVVAVHVLSHEAMHMSGIRDEARTECAALQRDARTARLLGATAEQARALAAAYWRRTYPRMPGGYRSAECRPGGALDEGLADGPW